MSCFAKVLKSYLLLGCLFNIALGIALIVAGSKIDDIDQKLVPDDQKDVKNKAALGFYIIGGVTIATGLFGLYGFYKSQKCIQSIFIILNIIYFIIFGAIFGASIAFKATIDDNLSPSTCSTGYLKDANETFGKLKEVWCNKKTFGQIDEGCACIIPKADFSNWSDEDQVQLMTEKKNIQENGSLGATSTVQECKYFNEISEGNENAIDILRTVEDMFSCSGVCEGDIIYYFNDVSKGSPSSSKGCFVEIADRVQDYIKLLKSISLAIAIICFINFMGAFIYCCVGNKKEIKQKQKYVDNQQVQN